MSTQFLLTPDAERHVLGLPGEQDRGDVRDRARAVSGGADADRQWHSGKLPDSKVQDHKRLATPHLAVRYRAPSQSQHART